MTSTPVSLNDSSLNGSWIDINSASQIPTPMDNESPEFLLPHYSNPQSMQNLGLISFQVERFLQEAAQQQQLRGNQENNNTNLSGRNVNFNPSASKVAASELPGDNNSGIYVSDSEAVSVDGFDSKELMKNLKKIQQQEQLEVNHSLNEPLVSKKHHNYLVDQLSDSLSLLSRASAIGDPAFDQANFDDFDWLWDWTAQPEYFTGQEWKVYAPKQDYLMKQRQLYQSHENKSITSDVVSLLFLTNFLSIVIGAGLTYSIMMRRSSV